MRVLTYYPPDMRVLSKSPPVNVSSDVRTAKRYSSDNDDIGRVELPTLDARDVMATRLSRYPVSRSMF